MISGERIKYFYEEINLITAGIGKTDLSQKLIEAAKEKDFDKMKSISRQFKRDNLELWGRMALFYEEYGECKLTIFYEEDDDDCFLYNPDDIDPIDLIVFMALSEKCVDEIDLFYDWEQLQPALEIRGYKNIAENMNESAIEDLYSLMDVCKY